ncbi:MAG TPA: hypothetical protein VMC79_12925, partial [Rectinemataceae bacterium]|nr:hypothetical protein [Rectinemataceae bacterium]
MKWMTLTGKLYAWTTTTIYTLGAGAATSIGSPSLSTDNVITDVQEAPVSPTTYHLLVGTGTTNVSYTANGYFESSNTAPTYSYHAGDSGSIAPSGSNSTYSTLFASKPVVKFFFDDAGGGTGTLFACIAASGLTTSNYGLVSIDATAGSWNLSDGWSAE